MKKVYVCTPLKEEKFQLELISKILLEKQVFAFIPPTAQLQDKTTGAILDKKMIEECDEVFVFGNIGRDCAWEIGYAQGLGKKVTFFVNQENEYILQEDWMTTLNIVVEKV